MKPLTIAAYLDGRLGHEKQTRGILHALASLTTTEVDIIKVATNRSAYFKNWAAYLVSSVHRPDAKRISHPAVDLIIGTGTHTHIPMLLEKKIRSGSTGRPVRVVTCMTPDVQFLPKFNLCLIPQHDDPAPQENVFVTMGPPNTVDSADRHNADTGLILVGGIDKKSHVWQSQKTASQIQTVVSKNPAMLWTVSSSPRTPEDTCKNLEDMAAAMQQFSFVRSEDTPSGWVEEEYAKNGTVWVTADSISMVYEALTAGCSVGILPVQWLRPDNKFQKSLNILTAKKMIVDFAEWQAGAEMPVPPQNPFNESMRCAREILRRWWPERLQ